MFPLCTNRVQPVYRGRRPFKTDCGSVFILCLREQPDVQIVDVDLGHAIQAQRRAEAAHARLVNSIAAKPRTHLNVWTLRVIGSHFGFPRLIPSRPGLPEAPPNG